VPSDPLGELARLDGVEGAVSTARSAVDARLRDRGLKRVSAAVRAQASLDQARATAGLTEAPGRWLPGCLRLAVELVPLSTMVRVAPGQVLARAHALVARGEVPNDELGRLRNDPGVAARMVALTDLLVSRTDAPALILAAVAHAEVATVEPFSQVSGVVARAVEHMVLVASGLDPVGVVCCEVGHAANPDAYRVALAGYRTGTVAGVRGWLLHCASAIITGARQLSTDP
jgi:hypothetical protein